MNKNAILNADITLIQCIELIKLMRKDYPVISDDLKHLYKQLESMVSGYLTIDEAQELFCK